MFGAGMRRDAATGGIGAGAIALLAAADCFIGMSGALGIGIGICTVSCESEISSPSSPESFGFSLAYWTAVLSVGFGGGLPSQPMGDMGDGKDE